jgi:hypothetical protein
MGRIPAQVCHVLFLVRLIAHDKGAVADHCLRGAFLVDKKSQRPSWDLSL